MCKCIQCAAYTAVQLNHGWPDQLHKPDRHRLKSVLDHNSKSQAVQTNFLAEHLEMALLFDVATTGDLHEIKKLHEEFGVDLTMRNEQNENALMILCRFGHVHCIDYFLDSGVPIDAVNNNQQTALFSSALAGQVTCFVKLVGRGADPNVPSSNGNVAAHVAAERDQLDMITCLLNKQNSDRALVTSVRSGAGNTPFTAACKHGCPRVVAILLQYGANINARDKSDWSGYMLAHQGFHYDTARFLYEQGAVITPEDVRVLKEDMASEDSKGWVDDCFNRARYNADEDAIDHLIEEADAGCPMSRLCLAIMLRKNPTAKVGGKKRVKRNAREAFAYFTEPYSIKLPFTDFLIGTCLLEGIFIPPNQIAGREILRITAEHGERNAMCAMGELCEKAGASTNALHWYSLACGIHHSQALLNAGGLLHAMAGAAQQSYECFRISALLGNVVGMRCFGQEIHDRGDADAELLSRHWWREASERGDGPAAFCLAQAYGEDGFEDEALAYTQLAAGRGCGDALVALAAHENNVNFDVPQAVHHITRRAAQDTSEGIYRYAMFLQRGEGVALDLHKAARLHKYAYNNLDHLCAGINAAFLCSFDHTAIQAASTLLTTVYPQVLEYAPALANAPNVKHLYVLLPSPRTDSVAAGLMWVRIHIFWANFTVSEGYFEVAVFEQWILDTAPVFKTTSACLRVAAFYLGLPVPVGLEAGMLLVHNPPHSPDAAFEEFVWAEDRTAVRDSFRRIGDMIRNATFHIVQM